MRLRLTVALAALVTGTACGRGRFPSAAALSPASSLSSPDAPVRELLSDPADPSRRIEVFWARPKGDGRFPVLVLLHGHQQPPQNRVGGRAFVDWGVLRELADAGVIAVAVSQPGYGDSDGPADFCGPRTQDAVIAVLRHFGQQSYVDPTRVALEGISRGAIVAAMVASRFEGLAGLVLISGVYDMRALWDAQPSNHILENLSNEAGPLGDDAFAARSPIAHVAQIRAPALVLSGARDPFAPPDGAHAFAEALRGAGDETEFVSFSTAGHQIPMEARRPIVARFLNAVLRPARTLE